MGGSPRWRAWHNGHKRKIAHLRPGPAYRHARQLNDRYAPDRPANTCWPYAPYACRWTNDMREGEVAPIHWHVGRLPARVTTALTLCDEIT